MKKRNRLAGMGMGGMFTSAALGLSEPGEEVQSSMFELDVRKFEHKKASVYADIKDPTHDVVYFIQEVSSDGFIKIGYSNQFKRRLNGLQTSNPRELKALLTIDGDRITERQIQDRFWEARIRGDWFRPTRDLLEFIEQHSK